MADNLDDLRSSFEYEDDNEEEAPQDDFEPEGFEENDEEIVEEETTQRRSPLRLILLVLLILLLLCFGCFFLLPQLPFASNLPFQVPGVGAPAPAPDTPAAAPTEEEPAIEPTDEVAPDAVPPEATEEGAPAGVQPTDEAPAVGLEATVDAQLDEVPTDEAQADEAPTDEAQLPATTTEPGETAAEPTGEPMLDATDEPAGAEATDEAMAQPTDEPAEAQAVTPVPGPTATPGPAADGTAEQNCDANTPPTAMANGPYDAMQGKGQAAVTFEATGSSDPDGSIVSYEWDFGDGNTGSGESVTHGYTETGSFVATLTVTDNCGATAQDTADVTIVGPTPPAQENENGSSSQSDQSSNASQAAVQAAPISGTFGFCHRVRYGETLSGLAWQYGIPLQDLARVNVVGPEYYVIENQGIFIPMGQIRQGPNLYRVQAGDTLNSIAFRCGLSLARLAEVNSLSLDAGLSPDQTIVVPPWSIY